MPGTVPGAEATVTNKTKSVKETLLGEERHNTYVNNKNLNSGSKCYGENIAGV